MDWSQKGKDLSSVIENIKIHPEQEVREAALTICTETFSQALSNAPISISLMRRHMPPKKGSQHLVGQAV